jgi:hypothetical protein
MGYSRVFMVVAGWNGFTTVADFYNTFEGHGDGTPDSKIDTTKDQRLGGRFFPGVTDVSGLRPGLVVGQQYNEHGVAETDRQGHPLKFTPEVALVEADPATLEITGIRVIKYPPDIMLMMVETRETSYRYSVIQT